MANEKSEARKEKLGNYMEILQAWVEGKEVELNMAGLWSERQSPDSIPDPELSYRVKPEPRVVYVNFYSLDGKPTMVGAATNSLDTALLWAKRGGYGYSVGYACETVEFREVIK